MKGAGISGLCERSVLAEEDPEKRKCFCRLHNKLPKAGQRDVVWNSMEACEDYKVIEKFDKVCSKYLKRNLVWLLPNIL